TAPTHTIFTEAPSGFRSRQPIRCTSMQAFVGNPLRRGMRQPVSPAFAHALMREMMKTERLRITALIIIATVLMVGLATVDAIVPYVLNRMWRGHFPLFYIFIGYLGFVAFESSVLVLVSRQLKLDRDLPWARRYLGAFIETSLPTIVIALHMSNMGAVQGLAFVGPLLYFVFIIVSTVRLEFCLSTVRGFVAAVESLARGLFHPAVSAPAGEPMLGLAFLIPRSAIILACGVIAGAVGTQLRRQFEASLAAATARDH